jgi:hypothetical protein
MEFREFIGFTTKTMHQLKLKIRSFGNNNIGYEPSLHTLYGTVFQLSLH